MAWDIKSMNTVKDKKRMMLMAKEAAIKAIFFRFPKAWLVPMAISTGRRLVLAALCTLGRLLSILPVTAFKGETFDAFLQGDMAARKTVRSPTITPAARPMGLI